MPEYIRLEPLRDEILNETDPAYDSDTINHFLDIVDSQPAADVVEVKHGEWIILGDCDFQCPECGFRFTSPDDISMFKFCRCGLKMDLNNTI